MSVSMSICIANKSHSASNALDGLNIAETETMQSASEGVNVEMRILQVVAHRVPNSTVKA